MVTPSDGEVTLILFLDSQGILEPHFQKHGENMNSASYCEVLLKLRDEIRKKKTSRTTGKRGTAST
jgi:hypothetical protein